MRPSPYALQPALGLAFRLLMVIDVWSIDGKTIVKRIQVLEKEAITWTTMGLDPGLCIQGPASDHLRYGITSLIGTKIIQLMKGQSQVFSSNCEVLKLYGYNTTERRLKKCCQTSGIKTNDVLDNILNRSVPI